MKSSQKLFLFLNKCVQYFTSKGNYYRHLKNCEGLELDHPILVNCYCTSHIIGSVPSKKGTIPGVTDFEELFDNGFDDIEDLVGN